MYCLSLPPEKRFTPLFLHDEPFQVGSPLELLPYSVLAIVVTLSAMLLISLFRWVLLFFKKLPLPPHFKPMIGAFITALIGIGLFYSSDGNQELLSVLGSGYGTVQEAFSGSSEIGIQVLLCVALLKMVTTSLTISSGGSGGVFGPSVVIGGCLGGAVGQLFHQWWPELVTQPQTFAIVGMAGFFAGAAKAPLSTTLMVSEITGSYKLLLPTMWVCALSFLLTRKWNLYESQVGTRLDSPAHRGDFIVDVLEGILVEDVYQRDRKLIQFHEGASLDFIVHAMAKTSQRYFPVVDSDERMVGIFSSDDVRGYLYNDAIWAIANARDVMTATVISVTPEDDLNSALTHFTAMNLDELPVVDPADPAILLGMLRRKETIAAYNRRLMEHKQAV